MSEQELKPCPFCGGKCDPRGWLSGAGEAGPECCDCGATATSGADWNRRVDTDAQDEPAGEDVRGRIVAAYGKGRWLREYDALVAERDQLRAEVEALREVAREFAGFFSSDEARHWELHAMADGDAAMVAKEGV